MAAKLRALTYEDINKYPVVGTISIDDGYDAINNIAKDIRISDDDEINIQRMCRRQNTEGSFRLKYPTFNYVLAGPHAQLLWKILGIPKKMYDGIVNYTAVWDLSEGRLIPIDDVEEEGGNYLMGAEIARMFIDKLDIDKEIENCLIGAGYSLMRQTAPDGCIEVSKGSGQFHAAADFYINVTELGRAYLSRSAPSLKDTEACSLRVQEALLKNGNSRFTYLYNIPRDKSSLIGMLNYSISVIPVDMRPKMDNAEHKLSKHYVSVIKYYRALQTMRASNAPKQINAAYKQLDQAVSELQYKCADLDKSAPDDRSILERIKSKQGAVRKTNLGKRCDYSGRAVVTIDPFLSIDTIRIPRFMLPRLYMIHILPYLVKALKANEYHAAHGEGTNSRYDRIRLSDLDSPYAQRVMLEILEREKLLDKIPVVIGRQPTLHRQSMQAFWVEPTDGMAITMNPLACPAFNMDFDGDQAHVRVPTTKEAIEEVKHLCMTTQNLFISKDGSLTTVPRYEMVYGLYLCTRDDWQSRSGQSASCQSLEEVREKVMELKLKVYDTVTVPGYPSMHAGDAAVMACFPNHYLTPRGQGGNAVRQITKKTIASLLSDLIQVTEDGKFVYKLGERRDSNNTIIGTLNRLVELGFKVSRLYPLNISILQKSFRETRKQEEIDKFHADVAEVEMLYDLGLETGEHYSNVYEQRLEDLTTLYRESMVANLNPDNGYKLMIDSGARGSIDNMRQSFGIKGRVQKDENDAFDAIIENSYALQLTPMEQFVAAYGSRQGMKDKSLKTGDTGYLTRRTWHAEQCISITCPDCGTHNGIKVSKTFLRNFASSDEEDKVESYVQDLFAFAITGRYQVNGTKMITKAEAERMAADPNVREITIRSPLTCDNPCCSKCFGVDWGTHGLVVPGTEVGIISAQSLGESTTQSSLNNFHKGGIVNKDNVTSVLDKLRAYMEVKDIAELSAKGNYSGYDPLAWASGKIITQNAKNSNYKMIGIEGSNKRITVPNDLVVKDSVQCGEGISTAHGDYDLREMMQYNGVPQTQIYLAFKLYSLFESTCKIHLCHFEALVAAMTRYLIVSTDRKDLMVGQYCTVVELKRGNTSNTKYIARICGVGDLLDKSMDGLDGLIMERQVSGLARACALNMTDSLTKPINRMLLGLTVKSGTSMPNFMEQRRMS